MSVFDQLDPVFVDGRVVLEYFDVGPGVILRLIIDGDLGIELKI